MSMGALNLVLYLAIKYIDDFEGAIIANTNLGGDNCHRFCCLFFFLFCYSLLMYALYFDIFIFNRGAVLGTILGAAHGMDAIPDRWITGLHDKEMLEKNITACVDMILEKGGCLPLKKSSDGMDGELDLTSFTYKACPKTRNEKKKEQKEQKEDGRSVHRVM